MAGPKKLLKSENYLCILPAILKKEEQSDTIYKVNNE